LFFIAASHPLPAPSSRPARDDSSITRNDNLKAEEQANPYFISLFKNLTSDAEKQPPQHKYNTLRSIENHHSTSECVDSVYTLMFNLSSIQSEEDVAKSTLRIFVHIVQGPVKLSLQESATGNPISGAQVTLDKSNFVEFSVGTTVHEWVKHKNLDNEQGFKITVDAGPDSNGCTAATVDYATSGHQQALLIVYTYDHDMSILSQVLSKSQALSKRSTHSKRAATLGQTTTDKGCGVLSLTITKDDFEEAVGIHLALPQEFTLNVCSGTCTSLSTLKSDHSGYMHLLQAEDLMPSGTSHKFEKYCVPTKFKQLDYFYIDQNRVSTAIITEGTVEECACEYVYTP
jgi:hypothetical protein